MHSLHGSKIALVRTQLHTKLKRAKQNGCLKNPQQCAVLWNEIEELSSALHSKRNYKIDSKTDLDAFCEEYPWKDNCFAEIQ